MKSLHRVSIALVLGASAARAELVISEIDVLSNKVEIVNTGPGTENLNGYWFCNLWQGLEVYLQLNSSMIVTAQSTTTTLSMPPGSILVLQSTSTFITDLKGELGLYNSADFGNPGAMRDYVCWGGDSNARDDVAAAKGIWGATTFVPVTIADLNAGKSIQLKLNEDGNSATDYELVAPTVGVNQFTPPPVEPPAPSGFRVHSLTLNGSGDLVISFTTADVEGPFILTSSDDLASDFTEETHAVYDEEEGTFTIPAAFVRPKQDFFKVETAP